MARTKRTPRAAAPSSTARATTDQASAVEPGRPLVGGRLSRDKEVSLFGMRLSAIIAPTDTTDVWRSLDLDSHTLSRITPFQLAEYLADISPEVSRALWDFLRECNAGHEIAAYLPGSDGKTPDARGQDALAAFLSTLDTLYGTIDVQINRLFMSLFLRGAICSELVLDQAGRLPIDLVVVDPAVVRAIRTEDETRGVIFQYGQQIAGKWVAYDRPTISYIPVDPLPASPYGRALVAPALFTSLFLIGLLHDLRRVIAQQGYPRYDIEVVLDELNKQMPAELEDNAAQQQAWLDGIVQAVATYYADLQPDDAFVHTSTVKLNRPIGTLDADSLGSVSPIIEALERMAVRSLKTAPFMLGISESTTETQANRQYEQHLVAVRAVQHLVENQLGRLLTLALQAQGIVSDVRVRFAENRASEEQRDQMVAQLKIANARAKYDHGWISQDQAAQEGAGVEMADEPEPRSGSEPATPDPATQENPDPSTKRTVPTQRRARGAKVVPLGADDPFPPLDPLPTMDNDDDRAALAGTWDATMTGTNGRYKGLLDATVDDGEGGDA